METADNVPGRRGSWQSPFAPLALRDFRLLWAGSTVSLLGDKVQLVALSVLALDLTHDAAGWASVVFFEALPRTALMLLAGVVIDRFRARPVLLVTSLLQGAAVALLALAIAGEPQLWQLNAYAAAMGVLLAFAGPTSLAVVPEVIPPAELQRANAFSQMTATLAGMLGAPLGGLLVAATGSAVAFGANAASFLAVAACLALIGGGVPVSAGASRGGQRLTLSGAMRDLQQGAAAAWGDPFIRVVSCSAMVFSCGSGLALVVGIPALATLTFNAGTRGVGILYGALAAGGLAGGLLAGAVRWTRPGVAACAGVAGIGIGLLLAALAPTVWLAAPFLALTGLADALAGVLFLSLVQTRVPEGMRGRVLSLVSFSLLVVGPLSFGVVGLLGDALPPRALLVAGGVLSLAAAALAASQPDVRNAG